MREVGRTRDKRRKPRREAEWFPAYQSSVTIKLQKKTTSAQDTDVTIKLQKELQVHKIEEM